MISSNNEPTFLFQMLASCKCLNPSFRISVQYKSKFLLQKWDITLRACACGAIVRAKLTHHVAISKCPALAQCLERTLI